MLLIVFVFLIEHIICFAIKCINFHARFRFSIIMRKNKNNREFNFELVERNYNLLRHNKWKTIFFLSIFRQIRKRYYDLRKFLNKTFVKFNKIQKNYNIFRIFDFKSIDDCVYTRAFYLNIIAFNNEIKKMIFFVEFAFFQFDIQTIT